MIVLILRNFCKNMLPKILRKNLQQKICTAVNTQALMTTMINTKRITRNQKLIPKIFLTNWNRTSRVILSKQQEKSMSMVRWKNVDWRPSKIKWPMQLKISQLKYRTKVSSFHITKINNTDFHWIRNKRSRMQILDSLYLEKIFSTGLPKQNNSWMISPSSLGILKKVLKD